MALVPSNNSLGLAPTAFMAKANPVQIRAILRVLSLLVWKKSDLLCNIGSLCMEQSSLPHLKVALCDQAVSISATAVLKNDLFQELHAPQELSFGVSLVHLVHALNLFASPGTQSTTVVTMRYPCDDGRLVLEASEPGRANRIRIASQRCTGMDFRFLSSPIILEANMKAQLLKEIAEGLEEAVSPQKPAEGDAQIIFSAATRTLTFKATGAGGSMCFNLNESEDKQWLSGLDVKEDGETKVRLDLLTNTVKTDYFRDLVNAGKMGTLTAAFSHDKLCLRVNAKRQLCLLYHIKPVDGGATSGVECIINPMADDDFLPEAP
eukprot:Hpha_TRINITY_DN28426_c0_g1::TRINITY_DN28426_c0_g1_i1::g.183911::m.183911/K02830/HRAD1, RAD17; cell cycle checkpoint protein